MKLSTLPIAFAASVLVAACQTPGLPSVLPPALEVKPQESWVNTLSARGVQVYECRSEGSQTRWTLLAPDADLFENNGRLFGHHGAGPTWKAEDGSLVVGKVLAKADAPVAGAIPWLLLETRITTGRGALDTVTRIRRVNTRGGVAPDTGCSPQSQGAQVRVPYTADYVLFSGSTTRAELSDATDASPRRTHF